MHVNPAAWVSVAPLTRGCCPTPSTQVAKEIARPVCWLLSGVMSPSEFACLPQTSTKVTKSPRICNGNTLLEDLAVSVPRARHDWSGILRLTRSPFPFYHHEILASCSNDAGRRSAAKRVSSGPGRFRDSALRGLAPNSHDLPLHASHGVTFLA